MELIYKEEKKGIVKIKITSLEDLWYLSQIITPKDIVKARTYRKIKLNPQEERNTKIVKKPFVLEIEVEKVEFHKTLNNLRITGKTTEAIEDIPKGSFHTISAELDSILTITKPWLSYQKEKLKDALKNTNQKIIICILDRDNAIISILKNYGPEIILELDGDVPKKAYETKELKDFYKEIASELSTIDKKYQPHHIIIASPAFWKEKVINYLDPALKKKAIATTCYYANKQGIQEVLKKDELKNILKEDRITQETILIENLLKEISKDGKATYGLKQVEQATFQGSVLQLLITYSLIHKTRENNTFDQIDSIMKQVDQQKGEIHIISIEHDAGKKLEGLTGIAAILRFKLV